MTDKTIQIVNALISIIPAVEMIFALIKCGGLLEGARSIIGAFVQQETLMTDVSIAVSDRLERHRSGLAVETGDYAPVDADDVDGSAGSVPTVSRVVL